MKKLLSIIGIFILMFGTSDWLIKQHYCEDEMVSFSFFSEPDPCKHAQEVVSHACCKTKTKVVVPKKCCSEKCISLKAIDVLNIAFVARVDFNNDFIFQTNRIWEWWVPKYQYSIELPTLVKPPPLRQGIVLAQLQSYLI